MGRGRVEAMNLTLTKKQRTEAKVLMNSPDRRKDKETNAKMNSPSWRRKKGKDRHSPDLRRFLGLKAPPRLDSPQAGIQWTQMSPDNDRKVIMPIISDVYLVFTGVRRVCKKSVLGDRFWYLAQVKVST